MMQKGRTEMILPGSTFTSTGRNASKLGSAFMHGMLRNQERYPRHLKTRTVRLAEGPGALARGRVPLATC